MTTTKPTTAKKPAPVADYLPVFEFHGVSLESSGTQFSGDCPFCHEEKHFFANEQTGQWDCKHCGKYGNIYTFLHEKYLTLKATTDDKRIKALASARKLPVEAIEHAGVVYDAVNARYFLPVYNRNSALVNLKSYSLSGTRRFYNTPSPIISHLYNSHKLAHAKDTVYICEGEWDGIALEHALSEIPKTRRPEGTVVAVPGADNVTKSIFTDRILAMLEGKKIVVMFDNDDAGRRGAEKLVKFLASRGVTDLHTLNWPTSYPNKYDVSDHITGTKLPAEKVWEQLTDWIEPVSDEITRLGTSSTNGLSSLPDITPRTKFVQVLADFRKHGVHVSKDMEGGLAIAAAAAVSCELPGDPLWFFLVGPSGSGKSLILEATMASENYVYRTTTKYTDLVSGHVGEGEENTTLIYKLIDKAFVIKDYTTILTLLPIDVQKMNGLLREAYDGTVHITYGNGKEVHIEGYFSLIAGVTNKIHSHQNSNLGERFLKYEIAPPQGLGNRKAIVQALSGGLNSADDVQNKKYRQASFCSFVDGLRERVAATTKRQTIKGDTQNSIIAMSQFVSICRTVVERDRNGALLYEPSPEAGTRLAKQLIKLPQALCHVYGLRRPDENILRIVRKTAWDSAYSRIRQVYALLAREVPVTTNPNSGLTADEICDMLLMPKTTVRRVLDDMVVLGVVSARNRNRTRKNKTAGRPEMVYRLNPEARQIFNDCKFEE